MAKMSAAAEAGSPAPQRRGKRHGSLTRVVFSVSCQPEEREAVRRLAKEAGKTVSAFLLDAALGNSPEKSDG